MKEINDTETEVLQSAIEALHRTTGLIIDVLPGTHQKGYYLDAEVRVALPDYNKDWYFIANVKTTLTRGTLRVAMGQLELFRERNLAEKGLLVTRYVTPQMAEELKKNNIQFLDTAGNAYLNNQPLYIFVKGNKPVGGARKETISRAFRPAGLRVVFTLLCVPGIENAPFREIAKAANVALGTVGWVMRDLKLMGNLIDMGRRGRRLIHKEMLLDRWVAAYPDQLRPKQIIGRFRAVDYNWWKNVDDIRVFQAYWGGETAAAIVTKFLKPQVATIYMIGNPGKLIFKNKMKKDPQGDIEILKVFWDFDLHHDYNGALVPPLLIYADLLATGDPRNIEIAKEIYEREIIRLIRED